MEVLSVTSEIYPLVKTGGLADVTGALPIVLGEHGVSARTLVPGYRQVMSALGKTRKVATFRNLFGGPARLLRARLGELELLVIDAPHLYDRPGSPYGREDGKDWPDNWARFAALGYVGAALARGLVRGFQPDIVHAHDWQSGLVPAYLAFGDKHRAKTVFTVHNLAFQGQFDKKIFKNLKLPAEAFAMDGIEYYGGVGFLKAGLQYADMITTVSPTYAREIRTPEFGMGLDGMLNARDGSLLGILNGIDTKIWNPSVDKALVRTFSVASIKRRSENKTAVLERFGLEAGGGLLFGVISRLTWQKGIDLLASSIDQRVAMGGRLCVLGSGEAKLETAMVAAAKRHPGRVGVIIGYDEQLSHLMQGGVDGVLVPSRFEPCGLTQLIGLRYGAVPVVARTGGLADTVIDANSAAIEAGVGTGILFKPDSVGALVEGLSRAIKLYEKPEVWARVQRRGMKSDVSWNVSAKAYAQLYQELTGS